MGLTTEAAAVLAGLPPRPPRRELSVEENRAGMLRLVATVGTADRMPGIDVRDLVVDHVSAVDRLISTTRVRLYRPSARKPLPCLVYAHGGGWTLGDLDSHDWLCHSIAAHTGCAVVAVDYRRAPEHRFPAALDDVCAIVGWACSPAAAEFGIDPTLIAVGGDSAGGNLAAASCLRLRGTSVPIRHQLLLLPVVDTRPDAWPSYANYADGYSMTASDMQWYFDQYLGPGWPERDNPLVAPYREAQLAGLPAATVITAECDVLRDEAEAFAQRLTEAGVPVSRHRIAGMFHPFHVFSGVLPEARELPHLIAAELRRTFRHG
ncbi:alpha/beta hydrolase [Nocardia nepalensis]|uniref:alpha/beta hydrolase n=1 Tax=Nocardia nepalensis TaxID=3375448 RepID=UPI003B670126